MKRPTISILSAFALTLPSAAFAQGYNLTAGTATFSSIAGTGTSLGLNGQDDGVQSFMSPISFPFFGATVSAGTLLFASTNGLLSVGASASQYSNDFIPTAAIPNNFIAPFWDDLTANGTAEVYYQMQGGELVVEWAQLAHLNSTTETISFQVRIAPAGTITYAYGTRNGGTTWSGTVGLENATGSVGQQATCTPSCRLTDVPSGSTLIFTPGAVMSGADLAGTASNVPDPMTAGDTVVITLSLTNAGDVSAGASDVILLASQTTPVSILDEQLGTQRAGVVSAGGSTSVSVAGLIPTTYSGRYYFALAIDANEEVTESNENNNFVQIGSALVAPSTGNDIVVTTTSLSNGSVGFPYDQQLTQTGATNATWSVSEGSLPTGLSLSSTGRLSGTPTTPQTSSFTVTAQQSGLNPGSRPLTLVVTEQTSGIRLVSNALVPATVGSPYTARLEATGGVAPYAYQVIVGKPDWMIVDGQGGITGTPDAPGTHQLTISIFDSEGADATVQAALEVGAAGPLSLVASLPDAIVGRSYSTPLVAGGQPPYTVNVAGGALPPGFAIDSIGALSGQAAAVGSFSFDIGVTDGAGGQTGGSLTLNIGELRPLVITTRNVVVTIKTDANEMFRADGGVAPYTWGIVSGALLPGLSFDGATGTLTGQTEMVGTASVTFSVADSEGNTAMQGVVIKSQFFVTNNNSTRRDSGCGCTAQRAGRPGDAWVIVLFLGMWISGRSRRARTYCRRSAWPGSSSRVVRRSSGRSDPRRPHPRSSKD